jgi:alanyl-tRNA synthetase
VTVRLYYDDAELRSFTARVVDANGSRVYLDQTAFYPTSGGQPHDLGTINGVPVVDVIDEDERIAHVLAAGMTPSATGAEVRGVIDWPRRHDHMQQHTGQHLLSAVLHDMLGRPTVSVHFGADSSTLDIADSGQSATLLSPDDLGAVEHRANEIVAGARPVRISHEDAAVAAGLRKPSGREGMLRIVTIEGVDRSACGGTHVASTAAIGPILIRRQERVKEGLRLEFVCGDRALRRARSDLGALSRIARTFSSTIDDAPGLVEAQAGELRELQSETRRLHEMLAAYQARELYDATEPDERGHRRIVRQVSAGVDTARSLALAVSSLPMCVFVAWSQSPPSVLLATSADSGIEAGRTLQPVLKEAGGRGGGSPRLAQGSAPSADAVDQVVARLAAVR